MRRQTFGRDHKPRKPIKAGQRGHGRWRRKGKVASILDFLFKKSTSPPPPPLSTRNLSPVGRLYRRTKSRPAFSALLISLACLLVSGAFLALLMRQAMALAIAIALLIGLVVWKSLRDESRM